MVKKILMQLFLGNSLMIYVVRAVVITAVYKHREIREILGAVYSYF